MVIRVLPASRGGIYSNAGSANFLVNYLQHEAREEKQTDNAIFFDQHQTGIDADTVQARIDANGQGLQKGKPAFHSLVISPSQAELKHIGDDPEKLTAYTRQVMDNYAANFADKRQRPLKSDDLVWFATIHRSRQYSGLDDAVQTGQAKSSQRKEGEQTHVHVVVSARDQSRSRSVHPDAGSRRFNYETWLNRNNQDFARTFGYRESISVTQHEERLTKQVDRLSRAGLSLDPEPLKTVGRHQAYSATFWKGMNQIERGVKQGKIFTPNQAFDRLNATLEPKARQTAASKQLSVATAATGLTSSVRAVASPKSAGVVTTLVVRPGAVGEGQPQPAKPVRAITTPVSRAEPQATAATKPARTDLTPLLSALRFESVPETGEQARSQSDEYRRKVRRRR